MSGSGCPELNGVYLRRGDFDNVPKYCHRGIVRQAVRSTNPEQYVNKEILFTLFRCSLPSLAKYWYISVADAKAPGTVKDKDYFSQKSKSDTPPSTGWVVVQKHGKEPCPVVRRCTKDGEVEELDVDEGFHAFVVDD